MRVPTLQSLFPMTLLIFVFCCCLFCFFFAEYLLEDFFFFFFGCCLFPVSSSLQTFVSPQESELVELRETIETLKTQNTDAQTAIQVALNGPDHLHKGNAGSCTGMLEPAWSIWCLEEASEPFAVPQLLDAYLPWLAPRESQPANLMWQRSLLKSDKTKKHNEIYTKTIYFQISHQKMFKIRWKMLPSHGCGSGSPPLLRRPAYPPATLVGKHVQHQQHGQPLQHGQPGQGRWRQKEEEEELGKLGHRAAQKPNATPPNMAFGRSLLSTRGSSRPDSVFSSSSEGGFKVTPSIRVQLRLINAENQQRHAEISPFCKERPRPALSQGCCGERKCKKPVEY